MEADLLKQYLQSLYNGSLLLSKLLTVIQRKEKALIFNQAPCPVSYESQEMAM